MSNETPSPGAKTSSTSQNYQNVQVTFPYDELVKPDTAVPKGGKCCPCLDRPQGWLTTPESSSQEHCKQLDDRAFLHGAGMFAFAEDGQTCSNACASKLEPSLKETAQEEFDKYIKSQRIYGEVEKGEGLLASLKDLCRCNDIDNATSLVTSGVVSKDQLTEYTFQTVQNWGGSKPLIGIPEGDAKATCNDVCNVHYGKSSANNDSLEPMYIGLPQSAEFSMAEL